MVTLAAFFAAALVLGTLVEYLLHRFFLHARLRHWVIRRHKLHHKTYVRYSIASEFLGFFPPAIPFLWVGFVHSTPAGFAFVVGAVAFVLAEAVAHKWSHEAPHRLFWMDPAVHAVHHTASVRWNYGVLTTFWDRVFGTYRVDRTVGLDCPGDPITTPPTPRHANPRRRSTRKGSPRGSGVEP